jgi:hypothetical protein
MKMKMKMKKEGREASACETFPLDESTRLQKPQGKEARQKIFGTGRWPLAR